MKRRIRIQGILVFLAVVATISLFKFLFPHWRKEALDEFLDALGITIVLFGLLVRIASRGYKSEVSADGRHLITDGLYGLIRHPMYFGTLLVGSGVILVLFRWWIFPLFLIIFLSIYIPQIQREEKNLAKRFGIEYQKYCKKVPKYFPHLRKLFTTELMDYLFFKWPWIKKELISILGVIIGIIVVETWEDLRLFGYAEFTKEVLELLIIIVSFLSIILLFYGKEYLSRKH